MKKLLWTISFLSVGLNFYLLKIEKAPSEPLLQEVTLIKSSLKKETPKKQEKPSCPKPIELKKISKTDEPEEKAMLAAHNSFDLDTFKKESSEKIDRFVLEELSLDLETSAQIVKTFEEGQEKFDLYLEEKQKSANPEGAPEAYFFDAYDYIRMGRNRLETRRKLKTFLGIDSFKQLETFIRSERNKGGIAYEIL